MALLEKKTTHLLGLAETRTNPVYIGTPPCGHTRVLHMSFHVTSKTWCWRALCVAVMQAVNVAGVGPFSEAVLCQTPCSVPAAVSNIYALKESELQRYETPVDADEDEEDEDSAPHPPLFYSPSTCLGICWDPPCDHGSEITSYLIDLGERQPVVVGPVTKHIIQHLQPDTSYRLVSPCQNIKISIVLHNFAPFGVNTILQFLLDLSAHKSENAIQNKYKHRQRL